MSEKKMKFAIIGLGWIFDTQRFIFKLLKRAEISAVVDKNEERAKKYAKKLKVPCFTDSKDLYKSDADFDAVYIATPHFTHRMLIEEAVENNKHVFCDKPITHTIADGKAVAQLAADSDVKIGINYQYRYDPKAYSLVKACQDGVLGKILYAKVEVPWYRDKSYYEKGPWRKFWDKAGGGTLITHASHLLDVLLWALGPPKSVVGKYATRLHEDLGVETEDIAMGVIEFESGALAQVLSSSCRKPKKTAVSISVFGDNGSLHYTGPWPLSRLKWKGIKKRKYKIETSGFINYSKILNGFIDWVWFDKEFYSTTKTALSTIEVVRKIYKSADTNQSVGFNN